MRIYYNDIEAGILIETDEGTYKFQYLPEYVTAYPEQFITFSMPVAPYPFTDKRLFAFFRGPDRGRLVARHRF